MFEKKIIFLSDEVEEKRVARRADSDRPVGLFPAPSPERLSLRAPDMISQIFMLDAEIRFMFHHYSRLLTLRVNARTITTHS